MTNLEKALFERLEETEENEKANRKYTAEMFDSVVKLSDALSVLEDFIHLEEIDGERYIIMDAISEKEKPHEFAKAYEHYRYIIDPPKEAEQEKAE